MSMEFIKKEYKPIVLLFLLFLINVFLFKDRMIDLYVDFGKECYLAESVLDGGILYKNTFAIFGPFSYLLNALLFKIFGSGINTCYLAGAANCFLILSGIYLVARNFLSKKLAFSIALFVLYTCCFMPHLMNYLTPYSYGMVYGLNAAVLSILCFVKYSKNNSKNLLYLSMLFAGTASACKYEFILYGLVLFGFSFFKINENRTKTFFKSMLCFLAVPIVCFCILFFQGLSFNDFYNYLIIWFKFAQSEDIKSFYTGTFYFSSSYFFMMIKSLIVTFIVYTGVYFCVKNIKKINGTKGTKIQTALFWGLFIALLLSALKFNTYVTEFMPVSLAFILFILTLFKTKDVLNNYDVLFLTTASLAIGLKSFFFVQTNLYGRYFIPLLLVSFLVILQKFYFCTETRKRYFEITAVFVLIVSALTTFLINLHYFPVLNTPITTKSGNILTDKKSAFVYNLILSDIQRNSNPNDTVVVLPEGHLLNFTAGRKSSKFNYLMPSLVNLYGEKNIVKQYDTEKPKIFVVITAPEKNSSFCNSWGQEICGYINKNYRLIREIKSEDLILIYKKI